MRIDGRARNIIYFADMKQFFLTGIIFYFFVIRTAAQQERSYVYTGEFGVLAGASQYFGDLKPRFALLMRPRSLLGCFSENR